MKGAEIMEGEEEQREGCLLRRIQEIRDRGARFQQRKGETRHLLLKTAEAMDKVRIKVACILSPGCSVASEVVCN